MFCLWFPLLCKKLISLIRSHLFIFVSIFIIVGEGSKKTLLQLMSKGILPILSSRSFIVSAVTFRSLIYFEFIFVYGVREYSIFLFYRMLVSFLHTTYCKGHPFSIVYSWFFCQRLISHMYIGLFLSFISCSSDLCLFLCQYHTVLTAVVLWYSIK